MDAEGMDTVDRMYVTEVKVDIPDADTFFPDIDSGLWKAVSTSQWKTDPESGYSFRFVTYERNLTEGCRETVSEAASEPL